METNIEKIRKDIEKILSPKRYRHSIGVMERAEELAKIYKVDVQKAKLVGIAHDIAKEMPKEEIKKYVEDNNIDVDDVEKNNLGLLHGKIGADICKKRYGFTQDMQNAIRMHTTGDVEMDDLAKILYLADHTEKNRNFEGLEYIRKLSEEDLDKAVLCCMEKSIMNVIQQGKIMNVKTILARNKMLVEMKKIDYKSKGV